MSEEEFKPDVKYIAIEGVIGAGKTSLAKKIKDKLHAELLLEQFDANPFPDMLFKHKCSF